MAIVSEDVRYTAIGMNMHGRVFRDDTLSGPRPGVLVHPEGFGISNHTYDLARRHAELGYVALACDLYGEAFYKNGGGAETRARHDKLRATPGGLLAVGKSAYEILSARPDVDRKRIAASGYCIGATIAIELAFSGGVPVAAVAGFHPTFHGVTHENAGNARGSIHVYMGDLDYACPPADRAAFEAAMKGKGVPWRMTIYGNVKHSYTNPDCTVLNDANLAYDAAAAKHSWDAMQALFRDAFAAC
jgi:dienelactone hydrolase